MTYSTFRLEKEGPVARVTLDRPSVKNAFDDVLINELTDALAVIAQDDSVRVMVLTGAMPGMTRPTIRERYAGIW